MQKPKPTPPIIGSGLYRPTLSEERRAKLAATLMAELSTMGVDIPQAAEKPAAAPERPKLVQPCVQVGLLVFIQFAALSAGWFWVSVTASVLGLEVLDEIKRRIG